ncbi:unnamed protein product [Owenia fusiformis]|uniref:Uncharacterized protein n=1 Tax=Owenia fusiformis TaxID=6347 RepID=A0A8J1TDV5_OWEFU|nr:unnamed protein product [Owenia fusiformis]
MAEVLALICGVWAQEFPDDEYYYYDYEETTTARPKKAPKPKKQPKAPKATTEAPTTPIPTPEKESFIADECSYTLTIPGRELQGACKSMLLDTTVHDLKVELEVLKHANHQLKDDLQKYKAKAEEISDFYDEMQTLTKTWKEIVHWPNIDSKFQPDNESLARLVDGPQYKDCSEVPNKKGKGIYKLRPDDSPWAFNAFCEDGWTVIQRRFDGSVDFAKRWSEFGNGFGDLAGEFWLGLENVHSLTQSGKYTLRVEVANPKLYTAEYPDFSVAGEDDFYRLSLGNMTKGTLDGMSNVDGQKFSTPAYDNDNWNQNCAQYFASGFWYDNCGSDLNTRWCERGCLRWANKYITKSLMKIKKN